MQITAGPIVVWVERRRNDWRVFSAASEGDEDHVARPVPGSADDLPDSDPLVRFCFADAPGRLVVSVAQADRPVVVRPATPLSISPSERVTLYVSTPVWMVLAVERAVPRRRNGRGPETPQDETQQLIELPLERPSDTWFGPNTRMGELCYATRTSGHLQRDAVPHRAHLAITPVTIENKATDPLQVERLLVPIPQLGVYVDTGGALWTNAVRLSRESNGDLAAVRLETGVPMAARGASERLAKPRTVAPASSMVRAFSRLLHIGAST